MTLINLALLYAAFVMAPCPIREVNVFKNAAFFAATFTGLCTLCFVGKIPTHIHTRTHTNARGTISTLWMTLGGLWWG